jgi:hypothetical protein
MRRLILMPLIVVAVAGCDRFPDLSVQVTANLQPSENDCAISPDQDEALLGGLYDLAVQRDYIINPQMQSYLVNNGLEIQADPQNIQIDSFDITILLPDQTKPEFGGDFPNPYRVTTSAVIPANQSPGQVSTGAGSAVGIPASYYPVLSDIIDTTGFNEILIEIRANGTTSGGFSQQSPPFYWPVTFCNGCLGVSCEAPAELGDPVDGACYPGQDVWEYCATIAAPAP